MQALHTAVSRKGTRYGEIGSGVPSQWKQAFSGFQNFGAVFWTYKNRECGILKLPLQSWNENAKKQKDGLVKGKSGVSWSWHTSGISFTSAINSTVRDA